MTHATEPRVTGNHADIAGPTTAVPYIPMTVRDILRAGVRRRARRAEMAAAQAAWDAEGGAQRRT